MEFFKTPPFPAYVYDLMEKNKTPGLAIAVVQDDKVHSLAFGWASLEEQIPCTPDTLFDAAAAAKSLTAASIALLVEDDENFSDVQYNSVMSQLLPDDFVMADEMSTLDVTIDDLLSHKTGIASYNGACFGASAARPDNAQSVTRNIRNLPSAVPLRSKFIYSNMMYTALSHLIEVKTKQPFADFLHEKFFEPLEMNSTVLQPDQARARGLEERLAKGYCWSEKRSSFTRAHMRDCPEHQGASSVISSANDFIKWIKALMNRKDPIKSGTYKQLLRLRSIRNPSVSVSSAFTSPSFYAAGFEVYYYRGHAVVLHTGTVPGFSSRFVFVPDFRFGAVFLGNALGAVTVASLVSKLLIDEALGFRKNIEKVKGEDIEKEDLLNFQVEPRDYDPEQESSPGDKDKWPQGTPLEAYTGDYWHPGYQRLKLRIKNSRLYIDATDRTNPFSITFCHLGAQRIYTAFVRDSEGAHEPISAEFVFTDGKVTKMGLKLEPEIRDKIWFERV